MDINKRVRGKNLLRNRTLEQLVKDVKVGNFSDIELGDYIVIDKEGNPFNGTVWLVGGINIVDRYPFDLVSHDDENGSSNEDNNHNHILFVCKDILPLEWQQYYSSSYAAFNDYLYKVKAPVAKVLTGVWASTKSRNSDYPARDVSTVTKYVSESSFIEKDSQESTWYYMSDMPENFLFDSPRASSGWGENIKSIIGQLPLFRLDPSQLQALPFNETVLLNYYSLNTHIGILKSAMMQEAMVLFYSNLDGIGQKVMSKLPNGIGIRPFVVFGNYSYQAPKRYKVYPIDCLAYQEDPLEIIIARDKTAGGYERSSFINIVKGKLSYTAENERDAVRFKVIKEDGLYFTLRPVVLGQEKYISMVEDETSTESNPTYCYNVVAERDTETEPKFNFRLVNNYIVSKLGEEIYFLNTDSTKIVGKTSQHNTYFFPMCYDDTVINEPNIETMNAIVYMATNMEHIWKKAFVKDIFYDSRFVIYNKDHSGFVDVDDEYKLYLNKNTSDKKRIWYYYRYDVSGQTVTNFIYTFINGERFYMDRKTASVHKGYSGSGSFEFKCHTSDNIVSAISSSGYNAELFLDENDNLVYGTWSEDSKPLSILYYNEEVELNQWNAHFASLEDILQNLTDCRYYFDQDYSRIQILKTSDGSPRVENAKYALCHQDTIGAVVTKEVSEITDDSNIWRFTKTSDPGFIIFVPSNNTAGKAFLSIIDTRLGLTNSQQSAYYFIHHSDPASGYYLTLEALPKHENVLIDQDGSIEITRDTGKANMPRYQYFVRLANLYYIPGVVVPTE